MTLEHPFLLFVAIVVSIVPMVMVARWFFGSIWDFVNDVGFGSSGESVFSAIRIALGVFPGHDVFFLKVGRFVLTVVALLGAVYHLLVLVAAPFQ